MRRAQPQFLLVPLGGPKRRQTFAEARFASERKAKSLPEVRCRDRRRIRADTEERTRRPQLKLEQALVDQLEPRWI